jgi:tetratricopeptide (TPR) repeat protein
MAAAADRWLLNGELATNWLSNKKLWYAVLPLAIIYSGVTYARNQDWKDNITLYKADIGKDPENTRLNYYYGCSLQKQYPDETDPAVKKQLIDDCVAHLKKSLQIYPNNSDSHEELGVAYFRVNDYDSAMPQFYTALRLSPKKVNASANLGTIYMNRKVYDSAIKYYGLTVLHDPGHALAYFNLAVCYSQTQKFDSAILNFRRSIDIAPDFDEYKAFQYTAILYKSLGKTDSAAYYERIARQYNPKVQF